MNHSPISHLRRYVAQGNWKYRATGPNSTEPAALACLALCAHGFAEEALPIASWFAKLQGETGSVGVTESEQEPAWPTSLAVLAWLAVSETAGAEFQPQSDLALQWILGTKGKRLPRRRQIGHDTTLDGWSWAADTHSWLEPTCFHLLALKSAGLAAHTRTRDGIALIVDRLHETGGCNYGNTIVLGQATLPHVQPTGLAMLALADENLEDPRVARSLDYLERSLSEKTASASLCFALLGLTAHARRPELADQLLELVFNRNQSQGTESCYHLALITLAGLKNSEWLPLQGENTNSISRFPSTARTTQLQ